MLGLVADTLSMRRLGAGEALFRQGDSAQNIFHVVEGRLRLERHTPDGRLVVLHVARAGEFFAEASLFAERYHCDAVAMTQSYVRLYPKGDVLASIAADPAGAEGLLFYMARQLQTLRHRAELRAVRGAVERVVLYLETLRDARSQVELPGALQDIAAELGLSREAFYRALAQLEKSGRIERSGSRIKLL